MNENMNQYLEKAKVLIEALPYIQRFNRKIVVVKYGGSAMTDEALKQKVIEDVTLLKLVGFKPIIVHGGGKEISKWVGKIGKEPQFINGLRVTDEETMEVAEMVLGKVNKSLVQLLEGQGVRAIGISGKDGGLLNVEKKYSNGEDIGFVGEIKKVDAQILHDLLEKDFLPVVCPVGMDDEFHTYNINADDAACAIARAMKAEKLAFLTDIEGVYKDPKDPATLISELLVKEAKQLIEEGFTVARALEGFGPKWFLKLLEDGSIVVEATTKFNVLSWFTTDELGPVYLLGGADDKAFSDCECELPVTVAGDELRVGSTVIAEKTWTPSLFQWHPKQGAYARYCLGVSDIVLTRKK